MPRGLLGGVSGIIREKRRRGGMKTHYITQQAKGLKGRPGVQVNLGGSHVECPKDAHRELVKGEGVMKVREKAHVHIKEGGTGSRPPQTHTLSGFARQNTKVLRMTARLQDQVLSQKLGNRRLGLIDGRDLNYLRIYPAKIHKGDGYRGRVRPVNSSSRIIPPHNLNLGWHLGHPDDKDSVVDEEEDEVEEEEEEEDCPRGREGRPRGEEG